MTAQDVAFPMTEVNRRQAWTAQQMFVALVPAVFMFVLIAFSPSVIPDGDPYWHIAAGDWILANGAIPTTDPFSHTFAGAPWTAHEWLSEIILATAYRLGGLSGLHVLVGIVGFAIAFLLARELLKVVDPIPAFLLLAFALANLAVFLHARPQFLTYPIIVIWLGELFEARRQDRAPRWFVLPLMVLWANLHGGFILGLALLGPFALEAAIAAGANWRRAVRDWTLVGLGALVAALITPFGLEGLLFPFKLMGMPALAFVSEWKSSTFEQLKPFEVTLLAGAFFCLIRGIRVPFLRLILLLGFLHMALEHRRFTVLFAIGAALLLAEPIARALGRTKDVETGSLRLRVAGSAAAAVLVAGIAAIRLAMPVVMVDDNKTPMSALASVPASLLTQPVFNDYTFGGYLIFKGVHPFIDGRTDMYGDAFVRDYMRLGRMDSAEVDQLFSKYGIKWAIIYAGDSAFFERRPGWRLHHKDSIAAVYVRETAEGSAQPEPGR